MKKEERGICFKRGQIKMSFGMIVSIILIIFFIGFAFFGIQKILGIQHLAQNSQFKSNLQNDVTKAWTAAQSSRTVSYNLPTSVQQLCFTDSTSNDMVFYGKSSVLGQGNIEHLNLTAMIPAGQSEECFNVTKGVVSFIIKKGLKENLVTITG